MADALDSSSTPEADGLDASTQRRLVTVLFCDLTGYTGLSEQLDPEDLQALLGRVFGEAAQIIARYGGHIDKFIGDSVMALFGVPESHEDDALRCIAAARDIHDRVASLGSPTQGLPPLSMHSGIETGVVVRGHVHDQREDSTVLGDVVNVAARLVQFARPGQIVVGPQTHELTGGSYEFEDLGEQKVRGRTGPVHAFRVADVRLEPTRVHMMPGQAPPLFGRRDEMSSLHSAVDRAVLGMSTLIVITGEAGTGKSRLVEELQHSCPKSVRWYSGYCYEYAAQFPYFPVVDLLGRAWKIEDHDPPDVVRAKIVEAVSRRLDDPGDVPARIARLWGLDSPELRGLDPESWRARLPSDIGAVLGALSESEPTVLALDDLHWADSSSLELLTSLLGQETPGVLFLCTARPPFELPEPDGFEGRRRHIEIDLGELDPRDAELMIASLLTTDDAPDGLTELVLGQSGGNPFYLQESVGALIRNGTLWRDDGRWALTRVPDDVDISTGVREMLAARLDSLCEEDRGVLRQAAVLGKAFAPSVLQALVDDGVDTRSALHRLVEGGVLEPFSGDRCDFRHVLVQQAVYDGILKGERQELHRRAACAIEEAYAARLPEHYEVLALHFSRAKARPQAVHYLMLSGEKSVGRYALDQADAYFSEAHRLLELNTGDQVPDRESVLVDLVARWAPVFWYRGDFLGLEALLARYADAARRVVEPRDRARYALWLGTACWNRQKLHPSQEWLEEALATSEEIGDQMGMCLAHAWLAYTLTDLGRIPEGVQHGLEARALTEGFEDDHFVVSHAHGASAYAYWAAGEPAGAIGAGEALLSKTSHSSAARPRVFASWAKALGYLCDGDYERAETAVDEALAESEDPWTSQFPRMFAGLCCVYRDDFEGGRRHLEDVVRFADSHGADTLGSAARGVLGGALIGLGDMNKGMALLCQCQDEFEAGPQPWGTAQAIFLTGSLHARIARRDVSVSPIAALRNMRFVAQQVPGAAHKAERELGMSLEMCEAMGARGMAGRCRMELGDLAAAQSHNERARELWAQAARDFEACGALTLRSEVERRLVSAPTPV